MKVSIYLQSADDFVKNRRTYIWSTSERESKLRSQITDLKTYGRIFYSSQDLWDCVGDILIGSRIDKLEKMGEYSDNSITIYLLNSKKFSAEFYTPELLLKLYSQQKEIKIKIKDEKEKTGYE